VSEESSELLSEKEFNPFRIMAGIIEISFLLLVSCCWLLTKIDCNE